MPSPRAAGSGAPQRSAALSALFPEGVVVFALDPPTGDEESPDRDGLAPAASPPLLPGEAAAVARAVPARRIEFARGRACARAALEALGLGAPALPVSPSRAPVWPAGVTGSITHCRGLVAAAVGRSCDLAAIGLDAEPRGPLQGDVAARIASAVEHAQPANDAVADAVPRLLFSAKEVVHKCIHPLTGVILDFLDVAIVFDEPVAGAGAFRVEPRSEAARPLEPLGRLEGRYRVEAAHVVAAGFVRPGG